eukprot:7138082-Lingulodinium_polyedra.AAC.1
MLISNLIGRAVQLPSRLCIPEHEFGLYYYFQDNHLYSKAKLMDEKENCEICCHEKFLAVPAEHCDWHGPRHSLQPAPALAWGWHVDSEALEDKAESSAMDKGKRPVVDKEASTPESCKHARM